MAPAFSSCARSLGARSTLIRCLLCPPDTVEHRSSDGTSLRGPDHMQSSKQDVTCKHLTE
ncbi:unnamed protein product [Staurois parvus]|uniref:Uncharacterized protein n=1 Tax=Staurois parvus TaxID=386267 RepID=A0ABN9CDY0_9NEOB|nr:unnamed protein product [Staurois parvus]